MFDVMIASHWVHDLDPYVFGERAGMRWYGVSYAVGALLALAFLWRWARQNRLPVRSDRVAEFVLVVFLGLVVGARVGYVVLYQFDRFLGDPSYLFAFGLGGMSSHGGAVGILLGVAVYARLTHTSYLVLIDAIAAVVPLGVFFGRLGNFINGELWGRPTEVSWAVIFPKAPEVAGEMVPRHPSQLYAAGLEGLLLFAVAIVVHAWHRKPGVTLGTVLVGYGIVRFINEFWRAPDVDQPVFFDWMTKGQLYSIPLFLAGLVLLIWALRRPTRPEAYALPKKAAEAQAKEKQEREEKKKKRKQQQGK